MKSSLLSLIGNLFYVFLKISDGHSFPAPLSGEEEHECFVRLAQGDAKARETLIEHNLRLVAHIVKKYYSTSSNVSQEDLISIGTIGLIKAIDSYRLDNGTRFATYAGKCLQNEILMYFRSQKKTEREVSIDETIDVDRDGNPLTYMDIIACDDTIADDIFAHISSVKAMKYIFNELDERERRIIVMRYGIDGNRPVTQREISRIMGISRSYVSRIEKSALRKIAVHLGEK